MMKRLLAHGQFIGYPSGGILVGRSSALPALCSSAIPRSEIGEKARSTAEEFLRVAKEKTDEVSESAKETLHETREAVVGESEEDKEAFKRRVEEGRYHQK